MDVNQVKKDSEVPFGVYFKELRKAKDVHVHYYRKRSAASRLKKEDLDADYITKKYLHIAGITTELSYSCSETVFDCYKNCEKTRG